LSRYLFFGIFFFEKTYIVLLLNEKLIGKIFI
jgi:hypothetical protein